jgi:hypothetical protein
MLMMALARSLSAGFAYAREGRLQLRLATHMLATAAHPIGAQQKHAPRIRKLCWDVRGTASVKPRCDAYRQEQQQEEAGDNGRGTKTEGVLSNAECLIELNRFPLREESRSGKPERTMLERGRVDSL